MAVTDQDDGIVMRFPQADDTSHGCNHETLVMRDGDCGAIQCESCGKRWQGGSSVEVIEACRTADCNPPWFRALKEAVKGRDA